MDKLVSVIIPAYNVEKYIDKCLKSIINQSYKKIEIIIIEDGSTDLTKNKINNYANMDSRIVVIQGNHEGVSNARNKGLDYANGDYITFLDSDDYLEIDAIESLVKWILEQDVDIVICGTTDVYENGEIIKKSYGSNPELQDLDKFLENIVLCDVYTCVVWGKIYKKEIIGDLRFNSKLKMSEDFDFLYRISKNVKKVFYNPNPKYFWVDREESAVHKLKCEDLYCAVEVQRKTLEDGFIKKNIRPYFIEGYVKVNLRCMKLAKDQDVTEIRIKCIKNLINIIQKISLKIILIYTYLIKVFIILKIQ